MFQISYLHQVELMPDSRFACTAELSLQPLSLLWTQRADWLACFIHLKYNQGTAWRGKLLLKSEIIKFLSVCFCKAHSPSVSGALLRWPRGGQAQSDPSDTGSFCLGRNPRTFGVLGGGIPVLDRGMRLQKMALFHRKESLEPQCLMGC